MVNIMRNFIQNGDIVTLTAPTGGVASGEAFVVGSIFGVAAYTANEGADVETQLVGVFDLPKATGAITQGAKVYFDTTAKKVTGTATGNKLVGAAIVAAGSGDDTVRVRLDGGAV